MNLEEISKSDKFSARERLDAYLKLHPECENPYRKEVTDATGMYFHEIRRALAEREAERPRFKIEIDYEFDSHQGAALVAEEINVSYRRFGMKADVIDVTPCASSVLHGPGHQSETYCQVKGPHQIHGADIMGEWHEWVINDNGEAVDHDPL